MRISQVMAGGGSGTGSFLHAAQSLFAEMPRIKCCSNYVAMGPTEASFALLSEIRGEDCKSTRIL